MSLIEVARKSVRDVGETFTKPDQDWNPVLFYEDDKGIVHLSMIVQEFGSDRQQVAGRIQDLIWRSKAKEAVFVSSAWMVTADRKDLEDFESGRRTARGDEKREEAVILTHVDADGTSAEIAKIQRSETAPPVLGVFQPAATGLDVAGVFVDAIRAGFR